ncbi:unnamed protein product [Vitrella brassicaformis CCMP3155]|uniref:Uncharacterized protein n=1 Tax=Vitrella brassicaformis (strain CCMP3155) TaxID=1169540 RepID=A0A0G4G9Y8_VITBC|nr:unnamed protein product [Vitrella brassicaformis CCMP3155]|eukprot:CEM25616.1 unnamed protein product [Vitrella brassicaformis CCMP3155]
MGLVCVYALSPKYAAAASTDRDRFFMAVIYLTVFLPPIGLVNKLVRSLKTYILFPRMLQSEAVNLSSKLVYSVVMSLFDLIMDISSPYAILLYLRAKKLVKARCKKRTPTAHPLTSIALAATKEEAVSGPPTHKDNDATERQHDKRNDSHLLRRQSSIMSAALSLRGTKPGLSPTGGLQSALASLEVSPRCLRSLCDQIHIWSNCELVALLFTNLTVLTAQAYAGAPWQQVVEGGIGLVLLVAIEQLFELCVLCVMMRWNNLPMLTSTREKGVLRSRILIVLMAATSFLHFLMAAISPLVCPGRSQPHSCKAPTYRAIGVVRPGCSLPISFSFPLE